MLTAWKILEALLAGRAALVTENLALRHQLGVLRRSAKRNVIPRFMPFPGCGQWLGNTPSSFLKSTRIEKWKGQPRSRGGHSVSSYEPDLARVVHFLSRTDSCELWASFSKWERTRCAEAFSK